MQNPIYLDYNATTPCTEEVLQAMLPYFIENPGNAASKNHKAGRIAGKAVGVAKEQLASLLDVDPEELLITSGATEANNLAIKGVFEAYKSKGNHIITMKTEHKAVLDVCYYLEAKCGAEVTYLDPNQNGVIDLEQFSHSFQSNTILVAIMWANNETGVIQPMRKISEICSEKQVILFSDATQAVGKISTYPKTEGIHILSLSAHKFYGPKGVGALYVSSARPKIKILPQIHGGGHQDNLRSGTLNVPGIVGMGKAAEMVKTGLNSYAELAGHRNYLAGHLLKKLPRTFVNGAGVPVLPNTLNICFEWINAEELIFELEDKLALSSGSACSSASLNPSHVLTAMGLTEAQAKASIRISLGIFTTTFQLKRAGDDIIDQVNKMRSQSPMWNIMKEEFEA